MIISFSTFDEASKHLEVNDFLLGIMLAGNKSFYILKAFVEVFFIFHAAG